MDSELFTIGGVQPGESRYVDHNNVDDKDVKFALVKSYRSWRLVANALYVVLIVGIIVVIIRELVYFGYLATAQTFTQKEGLQYLGASTNVVRDDTGWGNQLTPDEAKMLAQQTATTNMETSKATFIVPREKMSATPEEELLRKQAQSMS
jgi:hypothetical protein